MECVLRSIQWWSVFSGVLSGGVCSQEWYWRSITILWGMFQESSVRRHQGCVWMFEDIPLITVMYWKEVCVYWWGGNLKPGDRNKAAIEQYIFLCLPPNSFGPTSLPRFYDAIKVLWCRQGAFTSPSPQDQKLNHGYNVNSPTSSIHSIFVETD